MVGTAVEAGGENLRRLKNLLGELFMFDQADLDFGIYRIMKLRREEIRRFLDDDLLVQVREALGDVAAGKRAAVELELREAVAGARLLGMNPDDAPKVRELREQYDAQPDIAAAEEEVYSHLVTFFRRYYKEGDFISLRRYKEGVYAIPYEGEEVKLHWANADQYYVKSAEHFRDYTFLLADGRRVHFKLVEASTETNNNSAQNGDDRRFILADEASVAEQDGELAVRFEYRPDLEGRKRDEVNAESVGRILNDPAAAAWQVGLGRDVRPEGAKEPLSVLRKHLNTYTAKNEFDYFIHKDLGGFLRRELDFYVKNEVMHLDDIDQDGKSAPDVERYLDKLRAIRRVGHKIIDFLAQLEDFQKRVWLKKKFVVETYWCVTLDRVPEELYEEIAANERQRAEWVRLFAIDEIAGDMVTPGYSEPLEVDFLRANPALVVDTSFFDSSFTERLLACIDDLDHSTGGLLLQSDSFQALSLLRERYSARVGCAYIDPPYNTELDRTQGHFLYKDSYEHASWLAMMYDRLRAIRPLLAPDGTFFSSIDDNEVQNLRHITDSLFGIANFIGVIVWKSRDSVSSDHLISMNHNYHVAYAANREESAFGGFRINEGTTPIQTTIPVVHGSRFRLMQTSRAGIRNTRSQIRTLVLRIRRLRAEVGRSIVRSTSDYSTITGLCLVRQEGCAERKMFLRERLDRGHVATPISVWADAETTQTGTDQVEAMFAETRYSHTRSRGSPSGPDSDWSSGVRCDRSGLLRGFWHDSSRRHRPQPRRRRPAEVHPRRDG